RDYRTDVGQRRRRCRRRVGNGHALLDHALHAQQADAELVLDQLANGAHATIAEMVDVVGGAFAVVDAHHLANNFHQVVGRQNAYGDVRLKSKAFVDLVPTNLPEVVPSEVEEQGVQQRSGVVGVRRVTGTETPIKLEQRLLGIRSWVLVERRLDEAVVAALVDTFEQRQDLLVRAAGNRGEFGDDARQGAQQRGDRNLALAVDFHGHDVARGGLELQPGAA